LNGEFKTSSMAIILSVLLIFESASAAASPEHPASNIQAKMLITVKNIVRFTRLINIEVMKWLFTV
jgi:hypothetical protein